MKEVTGVSLMVAQEVPTSTTMALPHGPAGVADARRRLRADLDVRGIPGTVVDDAVLILSELVSNSFRHARPLGAAGCDGSALRAGAQAPVGRLRGGSSVSSAVSSAVSSSVSSAVSSAAAVSRPVPEPVAGVGQCCIRAAWSVGADGLLVLEVTDGGGPTRPRPSSPSLTAHGGRGLGIVESLALRWGVRDAPGEVTVWAALAVRGRHARRGGSLGTGIGLPLGLPINLPLDLAESLDDLG